MFKSPSLSTAPQHVIPPDGWTQKSAFGFLGFDSTPAGRLVRLGDVVRWLEDARCLPRSDAIQAVIDVLPADVMGWVYRIKSGQMAALVPPDCAFSQDTEASIALQQGVERKANLQRMQDAAYASEWGRGRRFAVPLVVSAARIGVQKTVVPVQPGRPALLQYLGKWVSIKPERLLKGERVDTLDSHADLLTYLAIPHAKAAEVWGWGRAANVVPLNLAEAQVSEPTTWKAILTFRTDKPTSAWSVAQKKILADEAARRNNLPGAVGVATAMATELGISVSRLNALIRTKSESGKRQIKAA